MFNHSYNIILSGILSMSISSVLIYFETLDYLAYALLGIGFIAIGIGLLLGFYRMIHEDQG
jgi:hypothetical protein